MHTVYSILQQSGSSPGKGPGKPSLRFTGMAPVKAVRLVYLMFFVALLFEFGLLDKGSLASCKDVEPFIVVPGIRIIPDSSTLLTPSVQAEGFAE